MPRLTVPGPDHLAPDERRVWDMIASGPRGRVEGPLRIWVKSPGLAERAQALGAYCRFGTSLPPRLSELAILITGAHWKAKFEWHAHLPLALAGGLSEAVAESIRVGEQPQPSSVRTRRQSMPSRPSSSPLGWYSEATYQRASRSPRRAWAHRSRRHPRLLRPRLDDAQCLRGAAAGGRERSVCGWPHQST